VGVDVDDSGGEDEAAGIQPLRGRAEVPADRRDPAVGDGERAVTCRRAEAVDDPGVLDDQVVDCFCREP
jgi:hypothetical protein